MQSGGLTREYILHVPPSYTGSEPVPLVLLFHGFGQPAADQLQYSEMGAKADAEGFIVVVPQALSSPNIAEEHWNFLIFEPGAPDDIAFIGELLDALEAELCVDSARVYSTGISNGAMFSVRLACDMSDRIAAIAPVAGVYYPPWSADLAAEPPCEPERPVPVLAFHGTADDTIPYAGGQIGLGLPFHTRHIENEVMPAWAASNGCGPTPAIGQATPNVRLITYAGCDQGADVKLYAVEGGGHVWPGADELKKGPDPADEISANALIWDFFDSHVLAAVAQPVPTSSPTAAAAAATGAPSPTAAPRAAALPSAGGGDSSGVTAALWAAGALASLIAVVGVGVAARKRLAK